MNPTTTTHRFGSGGLSLSSEQTHSWEAETISLAQQGSLNAFNNLVLQYQDQVYRQAIWLLSDEEAAQDTSQESFLIAYRNLRAFRGGSFRSWLLKITTNLCLDELRRRKRRPCLPLEQVNEYGEEVETDTWLVDPGETPEQLVEREELRDTLTGCIQRLSPEHQAVLVLVDLQEMEYQEAATILNIPVGTVRSRLARARKQLQDNVRKMKISRLM